MNDIKGSCFLVSRYRNIFYCVFIHCEPGISRKYGIISFAYGNLNGAAIGLARREFIRILHSAPFFRLRRSFYLPPGYLEIISPGAICLQHIFQIFSCSFHSKDIIIKSICPGLFCRDSICRTEPIQRIIGNLKTGNLIVLRISCIGLLDDRVDLSFLTGGIIMADKFQCIIVTQFIYFFTLVVLSCCVHHIAMDTCSY